MGRRSSLGIFPLGCGALSASPSAPRPPSAGLLALLALLATGDGLVCRWVGFVWHWFALFGAFVGLFEFYVYLCEGLIEFYVCMLCG